MLDHYERARLHRPGRQDKRAIHGENPGPRLYREVTEMDPARPIIKGSFCETDPYSGDSHNYLGSLSGGEYREIYEQREKLNTEYGLTRRAARKI